MTCTETLFHYSAVDPAKLSALSDEELKLLAEKIGIFLPDDLDRSFVIEEIIEALEEDAREDHLLDGPGHVEVKKLSGTGFIPGRHQDIVLPDRYHCTEIHAIPRDPLWIFAYWEIAENVMEKLLEGGEEPRLLLRVNELVPGQEKPQYFDISVSMEDRKWYINVPHAGAAYRIDLCVARPPRLRIIARSNVVQMPLQYMAAHRIPQMTRSLMILSGSEDLHLVEPKESSPTRILNMDGE